MLRIGGGGLGALISLLRFKSQGFRADDDGMLTVDGIDSVGGQDGNVYCETMDEALVHFGHLLTSEIEDPDGLTYVN